MSLRDLIAAIGGYVCNGRFVDKEVCRSVQAANAADRKRIEDCVETEVKALCRQVNSLEGRVDRGFSEIKELIEEHRNG